MIETLLVILGWAIFVIVSILVLLGGLASLGVVFAGVLLERVFDFFVPQKETGLGEGGIVNQTGVVMSVLEDAAGEANVTIQVAGELWSARNTDATALVEGSRVQVVDVEGMVAVVVPK